jgi:hypothetical protein
VAPSFPGGLPPPIIRALPPSNPALEKLFTRQYNPEDNSEYHTRRRENLKSYIQLPNYTTIIAEFNIS